MTRVLVLCMISTGAETSNVATTLSALVVGLGELQWLEDVYHWSLSLCRLHMVNLAPLCEHPGVVILIMWLPISPRLIVSRNQSRSCKTTYNIASDNRQRYLCQTDSNIRGCAPFMGHLGQLKSFISELKVGFFFLVSSDFNRNVIPAWCPLSLQRVLKVYVYLLFTLSP